MGGPKVAGGSARLLGLRSLPDALPGRAETIELWPLSQGEIDLAPDGFVDAIFEHGADLRTEPEDLHLLAAQPAGLLNAGRLAGELSISAPTVRSYLTILETIFIVKRVPAWSAGATARAIGTPKLLFVDSGLASHLSAGVTADAQVGGLLENYVLGELARQVTWSQVPVRLFHYRDRDRYEVDAVLENNAGDIVGIEVKAGETVRCDDFRGLRLLQRRLGKRFRAGLVLYCGAQQLSFGDGLACLPLSALWTAG